MKRAAILAVALCTLGTACDEPIIDIDLERMIDQKRYRPFQSSEFFKDGRAMRTPPAETVPRDRKTGDPGFSSGLVAGTYVQQNPVAMTPDVMSQGRERFDIFCAPCHGVAGDGESMVAIHMDLRRPPSLMDEQIRGFPDGRIFQVISVGYGLMRSYADSLSVDERWAVVAYVRALQLRSGVPLGRLPLSLRERAVKELP
jgi:mono/diheme cytochrome c family protein